MNPILARLNGAAHLRGVCFTGAELFAGIMVASTVASAGFGAYSAIQQGDQQAAAQKYNAEVAQQEATEASQVAQSQAEQQEQQTKQTEGQEVANAAASGVDPSSGSPLEIMANIATQGELSKQLTLWQGQYNATNYLDQSQLQSFYSANSAQAGLTQAGGTLLSGAASVGTKLDPTITTTKLDTATGIATTTTAPKFGFGY